MSVESTRPPIRLKDLGSCEFSRLSELLDFGIELVPAARSQWLTQLEGEDPRTAALLRRIFAAPETVDAPALLETREVLARHLASLVEDQETLAGRRIGPYRVLSLLGRGGMGSVWLAERADGLFKRRVALKLLHPSLVGSGAAERFAREREILASLSHPNIARLFDTGFAENGQPYLALQYVAGTPITTYCDNARLEVGQRLQLFLEVLKAVEYAHAKLIIHRDLKPSNILVTESGEVQLLDFGIAKFLSGGEAQETDLTHFGGRLLTPEYAAPEQVSGAPLTIAADVYALGVLFYEILTAQRPYRLKRDSRGALEEAILLADPVPPSRITLSEAAAGARATTTTKLTRIMKGDLDAIAIKALKKRPAERYATAKAFAEDITRFLRGDVVLAQPDSVTYRALKFARRQRVAIGGTCVLTATLVAGLTATVHEAKIASAQSERAIEAHMRLLTQAAAARLRDADVPGGLGLILEVLSHRGSSPSYTPEALSVFQEARAADAQVLTITGHTHGVRSAVFSFDGRRIVTASYDKTARIWDAATGKLITSLSGHADTVDSAVFSTDGLHVVTASSDKTARIWDVATGQQIMLLRGHTGPLRFATFSPDGQRVVTTSTDKTARIWDVASGRQIMLLSGHSDTVLNGAFSPDGRRLLTASADKTARIWDLATGREVMVLSGHKDRVAFAAFSPDGKRIVTASYDDTARVWDAATARQILLFTGHKGCVLSAGFSPDGRRIVTASDDKTARVWDAATGEQIMLLSGHRDLGFAAFSPDGRHVVTTSAEKAVRIWDIGMGQEVTLLAGHTEPLTSVAFSPDGRLVVSASNDKTARVWDAATGLQLMSLSGHTRTVQSASFSPDGQRVVTASDDATARIWEVGTGREITLLRGHTDRVTSAEFSPDGKRVVTGSFDHTARIWDAVTGREILQLNGHADRVTFGSFSPDGQRVVTASEDKTARIWDLSTGQQVMLLNGHTQPLESAAFSPDGRKVVTSSDDDTARIWDAATGQTLVVLRGHLDKVVGAVLSPDGQRVVTASIDKTVRIWDSATGQQISMLGGHSNRVWSATFAPDGLRVVTASEDKTARVWDARTPALDTQIRWAEAAQFDPLPSAERLQLGLPPSTNVRRWSQDKSRCDELAAAPYDPDRSAPGVPLDQIVPDVAVAACTESVDSDSTARFVYQRGRAMMARGDFIAARRDFEQAVARGYRSARVDLGILLSQPSAGLLNVPTAVALYARAWRDGVAVAGFELGNLYERGVRRAGSGEYLLAPDEARAWTWYQMTADAGQPSALARFAEREDGAAFSASSPIKRSALWLESFRYYTEAAEQARLEDWPDDAWQNWRYRRASLARLLAREGMMQAVAEAYGRALPASRPQPSTLFETLAAWVRTE